MFRSHLGRHTTLHRFIHRQRSPAAASVLCVLYETHLSMHCSREQRCSRSPEGGYSLYHHTPGIRGPGGRSDGEEVYIRQWRPTGR